MIVIGLFTMSYLKKCTPKNGFEDSLIETGALALESEAHRMKLQG